MEIIPLSSKLFLLDRPSKNRNKINDVNQQVYLHLPKTCTLMLKVMKQFFLFFSDGKIYQPKWGAEMFLVSV